MSLLNTCPFVNRRDRRLVCPWTEFLSLPLAHGVNKSKVSYESNGMQIISYQWQWQEKSRVDFSYLVVMKDPVQLWHLRRNRYICSHAIEPISVCYTIQVHKLNTVSIYIKFIERRCLIYALFGQLCTLSVYKLVLYELIPDRNRPSRRIDTTDSCVWSLYSCGFRQRVWGKATTPATKRSTSLKVFVYLISSVVTSFQRCSFRIKSMSVDLERPS